MHIKKKYRCYSPTALINAYKAVKEQNLSVRRASIQYAIPMQTLRDRVCGKIALDTVHSGTEPLFSMEEEAIFVDHVKAMATLGYGYTGAEIITMASNYAVHLGKRTKENPVTEKWHRNLKARWPEMRTINPRALSKERAQSTTEQVVNQYFKNLHQVLTNNNLTDKPHLIYNFDEKGIQTEHHPPKVLAGSDSVPGITSARSAITTVLACGNALGTQLPPYFIFKGQRMSEELLSGSTPGVSGTVTESGWSNGNTFLKYLENHFLQYVQRCADEPVLLILDGHRSHVNVPVLDWAKQHNVILMILPAHTSHILQPLDVGCFGPMQRIYNSECHKFLRRSPESRITRYNVCQLACTAYTSALSVNNLRSSFQKTGIFPFNKDQISNVQLAPSLAYQPLLCHDETPKQLSNPVAFFEPMNQLIKSKQKFESERTPRATLSKIVSGRCITTPSVEAEVRKHCELHQKKSTVLVSTAAKKNKGVEKIRSRTNTNKKINNDEPQPGVSRQHSTPDSDHFSSDSDDDTPESDKCCVCHRFEPEQLKHCVSLVFVKWAKCDFRDCNHWTHLTFCCKQRVVRRQEKFECPCHQPATEE